MKYLILGFCVLAFIGFVAYLLSYFIKSALIIHKKLDDLKEKVNLCESKSELDKLYEDLKIISKECWHKSFSSSVLEIKTMIETKYKYLK